MTRNQKLNRSLIVALAAVCVLGSYSRPLHGQTLMKEPLGDTAEPTMSLFVLDMAPGRTVPSHSHEGVVFAYVLEGEIENQVEPDPPQTYRAGGLFHERPKQVHRIFRNLSETEPAKILVFQNTATLPAGLKPLLQQKLANLAGREVSVIKITTAPGVTAVTAPGHHHPGPVFAYLLQGEIESQVHPDPPVTYHAGDVFYEPPMHPHTLYRNLSATEPAELLIFSVLGIGEPFSVRLER